MKVLFRTDASSEMGTGHFMRCLALAHVFRDNGWTAHFMSKTPPDFLIQRLTKDDIAWTSPIHASGDSDDAQSTLHEARRLGADWIVIDGYQFRSPFQQTIQESGQHLLAIDDFNHAGYQSADIVLNQNLHATLDLYPKHRHETRFLLGPEYLLLRREFLRIGRSPKVMSERADRLLVSLGGADSDNLTERILQAMQLLPRGPGRIKIVVGPSNPHRSRLSSFLEEKLPHAELLGQVENMASLMAWADLAISSGGTTIWELAYIGVPAIVGQIASAEDHLVAGLQQRGLFECVGWFKNLSPESLASSTTLLMNDAKRRLAMSREGQQIIDGKGGQRVLLAMQEVAAAA